MPRSFYLLTCCSFLLTCLAPDAQAQTATLTPGQTHNGTLSSSDLTVDDGQHVQCFNLNAQANQELTITLSSRQFDTVMMAGTGRCGGGDIDLTMINDDFESNSTNSQLNFTTTQRDYVIAVTSYDAGETGSFTLSITQGAPPPSTETVFHVGSLSTGQQYTGNLTSNSVTLDSGEHVQCVELDLQANRETTVTLRSGQFDTHLFIGTGRCSGDFDLTLENDDFENDSTNSQLSFTASQAQYVAMITSYAGGETGSYTLSVE